MKKAFWCCLCRQWTTIEVSEEQYTKYRETGDGRSLRGVGAEAIHLIANGCHEACAT